MLPPDVIHDLVLVRAHPHFTDPDGSQEWWAEVRGQQQLLLFLWPDGTQYWHRDGRLHRDGDRPAMVWADGAQEWYRDGRLHRDGDRPAYVGADGRQEWWVDGKRIR